LSVYGGRSREIVDFLSWSIKGNPRRSYKATGYGLTLAPRLRIPPMISLSCINQHANIRVINRRVKFPCSCHYIYFYYMLRDIFKNRCLQDLTGGTSYQESVGLYPKFRVFGCFSR
jgi:hypothetical protein